MVYSMLNQSVIKLLKSGMWDLATCANGEPNVVPVAFKDITDDGKLVVGDVFLETTISKRTMEELQFRYMMHRIWRDIRSRERLNM